MAVNAGSALLLLIFVAVRFVTGLHLWLAPERPGGFRFVFSRD